MKTKTSKEDPVRRLDDLPDVMDLWPTVGRFLGLCKDSTYAAFHRGDIPGFKVGRRILVGKQNLSNMINGANSRKAI